MLVSDCETVFRQALNKDPYDYQVRAWEAILACCQGGPPVLIEAPTAAGKTEAAVTPYVTQLRLGEYPLARRLIYVLPSRSLVEAQVKRIRDFGQNLGLALGVRVDHGSAGPLPMFFGDVVVTTWDSFLYGLVGQRTLPRRFTIPAGNIATSMVVFDEVQMYQDAYFYSQRLMGRVAKVLESTGIPLVVMTATLSQAHREEVFSLQGYCPVVPQAGDVRKPARGTVEVKLIKSQSAYDLLANPDVQEQIRTQTSQGNKGLIVVNTVSRAVHVYKKFLDEGWSSAALLLLHSRFLAGDRRELEKRVLDRQFSLLIATQVVEAGLDIPGVTRAVIEAAPPDALIQRIGRVARRPGEMGLVWVVEPRNAGEDALSLSPYAFISESRIKALEAELAADEGKKQNRYRDVGRFALSMNETMRKTMTEPGTVEDLQAALTDLGASQKLVNPFYRELWGAWRKLNNGESQESSENEKA